MKHLPRAAHRSWKGMMLTLALAWSSACSSSSPVGAGGAGRGGAGPASLGQGGQALAGEIFESASTNSRSMKVEIFANASAERTIGPPTALEADTDGGLGSSLDGTPKSFPPGSTDVLAVLQALAAVNDLSAIPIGRNCPKSISLFFTVLRQAIVMSRTPHVAAKDRLHLLVKYLPGQNTNGGTYRFG